MNRDKFILTMSSILLISVADASNSMFNLKNDKLVLSIVKTDPIEPSRCPDDYIVRKNGEKPCIKSSVK